MKTVIVTGELAAAARAADLRRLLERARRRLGRGRRIGPDYLYVAYWAAIQDGRPETIEQLRAALRRAHA